MVSLPNGFPHTSPGIQKLTFSVVGMAKLGVEFDASCIITYAYQPCLLHVPPVFGV